MIGFQAPGCAESAAARTAVVRHHTEWLPHPTSAIPTQDSRGHPSGRRRELDAIDITGLRNVCGVKFTAVTAYEGGSLRRLGRYFEMNNGALH